MQRTPRTALSPVKIIDARRHRVYEWMINGYTIDGSPVTAKEIANREGVLLSDIRKDISSIQRILSKQISSAPAFRTRVLSTLNVMLEMSLRDRGHVVEQLEDLRSMVKQAKSVDDKLSVMDRLAKFIRLEQDSTKQTTDLMKTLLGIGDIDLNMKDSTDEDDSKLTVDQAIDLISQHDVVDILPTGRTS